MWTVACGLYVVPKKLRDLVQFVKTGRDQGLDFPWWEGICKKRELPRYLGGSVAAEGMGYHEWLISRIKNDSLLY